jgi:hypothetical protein
MDCDKFESAMMDELYGELDEVTSAAVKRHLASCGRCATLFGGLRATRRVAVMPKVEPPPGLERTILNHADNALRVVPFRRRVAQAVSVAGSWAMRPQTAMAAVSLVMLGASVLLLRGRSSRAPASAEMTVTQEGTPAPAAPSTAPLGAATDLAPPPPMGGPLASNERAGEAKAAAPPVAAGGPAQEPPTAIPRARAFAKAPPPSLGAEATKASPARDLAIAVAPVATPVAAWPGAAQGARSAPAAPAERGDPGDGAVSDLATARSLRDTRGCRTAIARFDEIARRSAGTPVGWDALLDSAMCCRFIGDNAGAQARLNALLNVESYKERARIELEKLDRTQQGQTR